MSSSIWNSSGTSQSSSWIIDLLSYPHSQHTKLNHFLFNSCFHPKHVKQKVCCKNHMQFTYYGIINIMENGYVCNTILTEDRYKQILFNTRQIYMFIRSFHYNRLCFSSVNIMAMDFCCFAEIMLRTEIKVLIFWGRSRSQYIVWLEMIKVLRASATEFSELRRKTSSFYPMLQWITASFIMLKCIIKMGDLKRYCTLNSIVLIL